MRNILSMLAMIALVAVVITLTFTELNNSITERNESRAAYMDAYGRAQAMIIYAKGEAAKDYTMAALPWAVLGITLVCGVVGLALITRQPAHSGQRLIERRIVYYLPQSDVIDLPRRLPVVEVEHERN